MYGKKVNFSFFVITLISTMAPTYWPKALVQCRINEMKTIVGASLENALYYKLNVHLNTGTTEVKTITNTRPGRLLTHTTSCM